MPETITIHQMFGKAILQSIELDRLHTGRYQPRKDFAEEALEQLTKTVDQLGVIEPLIVRLSQTQRDCFEIIAGERRFRAAKRAGFITVPCLLTNYSDEQAAQVALIENTSREDLNPIEKAQAMKRMVDEFRYKHDEVADLLGIARASVSNLLRLLKLDGRVQHWMKQGSLSEGHGKVLASLGDDNQYWFAYEALKKEWSVNTLTEEIKRKESKSTAAPVKPKRTLTPLEQQLSDQFESDVKVSIQKNEAGHFKIPFQDYQHMQKILAKLGCDNDGGSES